MFLLPYVSVIACRFAVLPFVVLPFFFSLKLLCIYELSFSAYFNLLWLFDNSNIKSIAMSGIPQIDDNRLAEFHVHLDALLASSFADVGEAEKGLQLFMNDGFSSMSISGRWNGKQSPDTDGTTIYRCSNLKCAFRLLLHYSPSRCYFTLGKKGVSEHS